MFHISNVFGSCIIHILYTECAKIKKWFRRQKGNANNGIPLDKANECTLINPLTPNDAYRGRTAPLTSKRCILCIYSTNIGIEYFKHGIYSPFFFIFKMQFVS